MKDMKVCNEFNAIYVDPVDTKRKGWTRSKYISKS